MHITFRVWKLVPVQKERKDPNITYHITTSLTIPARKKRTNSNPTLFNFLFLFWNICTKDGNFLGKERKRKERKKSESISFAQSKGSNYNRREEDPNLKYFQSIFACSDNSLNIYI